jgi:hypothetical protein
MPVCVYYVCTCVRVRLYVCGCVRVYVRVHVCVCVHVRMCCVYVVMPPQSDPWDLHNMGRLCVCVGV